MSGTADEERYKLVIGDDEEKGGGKNRDLLLGTERDDDTGENDISRSEILPGEEGMVERDDEEVFTDEPAAEVEQAATTRFSRLHRIVFTCALPDDRATFYGMKLVDGPPAVKFLKFVFVTFVEIAFMHWFVRKMDWEHREQFTLGEFWTYESSMVVLDSLFFFAVARLWRQRGVDHLAFILLALAANIYASFITAFPFLQQSFTLYNMHCTWSWKLWVFILILIPLIVTIILLHVNYAVQRGLFVMKFLELVLATVFLLMPSASSPYMHLHHWFAGWIIGMHCNFDVWWSRSTLAWCWGLYMNGIAVYGRDPVLTCGFSLFLSKQQRCPYLDCYLAGIVHTNNDTNTTIPQVEEMKTPDWRNCSADAYHP